MLCQRHYNKATIPALLDAHLAAALRENSQLCRLAPRTHRAEPGRVLGVSE